MHTIKEWRRLKGLSQTKLAESVGVSVPTIWRWETDSSIIMISDCYKLAEALGVKLEDIIFLPKTSI